MKDAADVNADVDVGEEKVQLVCSGIDREGTNVDEAFGALFGLKKEKLGTEQATSRLWLHRPASSATKYSEFSTTTAADLAASLSWGVAELVYRSTTGSVKSRDLLH